MYKTLETGQTCNSTSDCFHAWVACLQPPDASLLVGTPQQEPALLPVSPVSKPLLPVTASSTAGLSSNALGAILGVGIPLAIGLCKLCNHTRILLSFWHAKMQARL